MRALSRGAPPPQSGGQGHGPSQGKARWLVVGLVVSLVLNLALIGFLVGAAGQPPPWRSSGFDATAGFSRLVRFLPEERRAAVFGNGDDVRREIRQSLRTMRRAQHSIEEALAAEPFDPDRLAAALEDFRAQFTTNQQRSHAGLVSIMEKLTPDERRRFVESIQHMRDPRHHRGRRDGRDRDRDDQKDD